MNQITKACLHCDQLNRLDWDNGYIIDVASDSLCKHLDFECSSCRKPVAFLPTASELELAERQNWPWDIQAEPDPSLRLERLIRYPPELTADQQEAVMAFTAELDNLITGPGP